MHVYESGGMLGDLWANTATHYVNGTEHQHALRIIKRGWTYGLIQLFVMYV